MEREYGGKEQGTNLASFCLEEFVMLAVGLGVVRGSRSESGKGAIF